MIFEPLLYLCGFACCFWSLTKRGNLNDKAEARGTKCRGHFSNQLSTRCAQLCSSTWFQLKDFWPFNLLQKLFCLHCPAKAHSPHKVCSSVWMLEFFPPGRALWGEAPVLSSPHCRRAAGHSQELQEQDPTILHRDKVLLPAAVVCTGGSLIHSSSRILGEGSLAGGKAAELLLAGVQQELGSCFLLKSTYPKKCNLASQLWLRTCLLFTGCCFSGLSHTLWGSSTSRTQAFSPAPGTERLCIRNGVLGCILAGQWGQVSVWQSQTFVSPTVELHPVAVCCHMDGTDP